ncbi:hypothetical protein [Isoptericola sp. AK164]|uniref:hypothetical protein n=1 Tax=Isoptericola sp. AK164 TaxID=3024246 RepID=UPI002418A75D|nr:hypothetical protein [Isoptericola sp. AK164]
MTTIMPHPANTTPEPDDSGARHSYTRRTIALDVQPSPDTDPSDAVVQGIRWTEHEAPTVHVYVNDGLAVQLTPAEARTVAAMLSLSAAEIDGSGPSAPALRAVA